MIILDTKGQTEKKFRENKGVFAVEPDFFDMFDFAWLAGNPHSSLKDPHSAVLTRETAIRYFGDWQHALGRTIRVDDILVKVTGILATIPANTDFQLKIVLPYGHLFGFDASSDWTNSSSSHDCYILLPPGETRYFSFRQAVKGLSQKVHAC